MHLIVIPYQNTIRNYYFNFCVQRLLAATKHELVLKLCIAVGDSLDIVKDTFRRHCPNVLWKFNRKVNVRIYSVSLFTDNLSLILYSYIYEVTVWFQHFVR